MIKLIAFIAVFMFVATSCKNPVTNGIEKGAIETQAIKASYENYKRTILEDKGEEAVNYLDSRTLRYYETILEKVKTADKDEANSLSFIDKLIILRIRLIAKKEEILSFDGRSLVVFAIKNGMVGKDSVINNSIGEINIKENFAMGQLIVKGQKTDFYQHFYKENGQWKLDITSLFLASTIVFKKLIDESEMSENEYLFELLERVSNKKVNEDVWIPTKKLKP